MAFYILQYKKNVIELIGRLQNAESKCESEEQNNPGNRGCRVHRLQSSNGTAEHGKAHPDRGSGQLQRLL